MCWSSCTTPCSLRFSRDPPSQSHDVRQFALVSFSSSAHRSKECPRKPQVQRHKLLLLLYGTQLSAPVDSELNCKVHTAHLLHVVLDVLPEKLCRGDSPSSSIKFACRSKRPSSMSSVSCPWDHTWALSDEVLRFHNALKFPRHQRAGSFRSPLKLI